VVLAVGSRSIPGHVSPCWDNPNRLDAQGADAQGVCWQSGQFGYSKDLLAYFSRAGEVVAALAVTGRVSGLCRGFGFVEMAELADVAVAFSRLNNTLLNGQQLKIEADPSEKWQGPKSRGAILACTCNGTCCERGFEIRWQR
jgi:hypothetical protein